MPFIGKDWRSPGEAWVKTDEGSWEKLKILETSVRHNEQSGFYSSNSSDSSNESDSETDCSSAGSGDELVTNSKHFDDETCTTIGEPSKNCRKIRHCSEQWPESPVGSPPTNQPPFCQITLKSTREVAGYNTISEAFYRLDFCSAIRDIRRFNYVCKLLHLLINQSLTTLSGCATKVLFVMLEQLAWQVSSNQQNIHILRTLLDDLKKMVDKYYCWGRPLGSTLVWEQHLQTLEKICNMASSIQIKEPTTQGGKQLTDLPEEVIREILLRLSDYNDLKSSRGAYQVMGSLLDEQHVWKQLCMYHFTRLQVKQATQKFTSCDGKIDWEQSFNFLRKKFGLKEEYAETLFLCRVCRCLFWQSFGHPCVDYNEILDNQSESKSSSQSQSPPPSQSQSPPPSPPAVEPERFVTVPLHIPVPPQAFLKFFSL